MSWPSRDGLSCRSSTDANAAAANSKSRPTSCFGFGSARLARYLSRENWGEVVKMFDMVNPAQVRCSPAASGQECGHTSTMSTNRHNRPARRVVWARNGILMIDTPAMIAPDIADYEITRNASLQPPRRQSSRDGAPASPRGRTTPPCGSDDMPRPKSGRWMSDLIELSSKLT